MRKKIDIITSDKIIVNKIYEVNGQKVLIDQDLAELYGVETKRLNEQVKRNAKRFPSDFMFQLTKEEFESLKSQIATSKRGGRRTLPYAFTENGVAMLSSVLNSDQAIIVNIQIIRMFTRMREFLLTNKSILLKLNEIEDKVISNETVVKMLFDLMKKLLAQEDKSKKKIGYK